MEAIKKEVGLYYIYICDSFLSIETTRGLNNRVSVYQSGRIDLESNSKLTVEKINKFLEVLNKLEKVRK